MKNERFKFGVIIQARMNSSRLPGKVMMDIDGAPMLRRQIERLLGGLRNIPVVVATSSESTDDASHRDGWPYGCAAELISVDALLDAHRATKELIYLEHTIPYFFDHSDDFSMHRVVAPENLRRPDLFFSVDYQEDLDLVRKVYKQFLIENAFFSMKEVIEFMDANPDLKSLNAHLHDGFDR